MTSRTGIVRARWKQQIKDGHTMLCAICKEPIPIHSTLTNKGSVSVDHIIPKAHGGSDRVENLQPTHSKCNWAKGDDATLSSQQIEKKVKTFIKIQIHKAKLKEAKLLKKMEQQSNGKLQANKIKA